MKKTLNVNKLSSDSYKVKLTEIKEKDKKRIDKKLFKMQAYF